MNNDYIKGMALWQDEDGWRGYIANVDKSLIYFNDIPNESFIDAMDHLLEKYE